MPCFWKRSQSCSIHLRAISQAIYNLSPSGCEIANSPPARRKCTKKCAKNRPVTRDDEHDLDEKRAMPISRYLWMWLCCSHVFPMLLLSCSYVLTMFVSISPQERLICQLRKGAPHFFANSQHTRHVTRPIPLTRQVSFTSGEPEGVDLYLRVLWK